MNSTASSTSTDAGPRLQLRRVGLLWRDDVEDFPVSELAALFASQGIDAIRVQPADGDQGPLDLVVAMGGDGTVLRALDRFAGCPVLAINFGTVGFLTAGDRTDFERIVSLLVAGQYVVSERLVLACRYPDGSLRAVNEVIVRTGNSLIYVDVSVDGAKIRTIRGDGVVVGTPTGSTGFLLSTGAPIVMPGVRCMVLDGINEYNFTSRAIILTPDSRICLHVSPLTRRAQVSLVADGRPVASLDPGDDVFIEQAQESARLIYLEPHYFFHNLSSRLSW